MAKSDITSLKTQLGVINDNTECQYLSHEDVKLLKLKGLMLNCLHLNIRSFHKNCEDLLLSLDNFAQAGVEIHVILLCETFLTTISVSLAEIKGYTSYHKVREDKIGGGVSIFVMDTITVNNVYKTEFTKEIESHFVNITFET